MIGWMSEETLLILSNELLYKMLPNIDLYLATKWSKIFETLLLENRMKPERVKPKRVNIK